MACSLQPRTPAMDSTGLVDNAKQGCSGASGQTRLITRHRSTRRAATSSRKIAAFLPGFQLPCRPANHSG